MSHQRAKFSLKYLAAASALALTMGTSAFAQCTPASPSPGDTVTCAPGSYSGLNYSVADLTLVVGSSGSATTVINNTGNAIQMTSSSGYSRINMYDTTVSSLDDGIYAAVFGSSNGINIYQSGGSITGEDGGIDVRNSGFGTTTITAGNVFSQLGDGIQVTQSGSASDIDITLTGNVDGNRAIYIDNNTAGHINIDTNSVGIAFLTSDNTGIDINSSTAGSDTTIDLTGANLDAGFNGIRVISQGDVSVTTDQIDAGYFGVRVLNSNAANGSITVTSDTTNAVISAIAVSSSSNNQTININSTDASADFYAGLGTIFVSSTGTGGSIAINSHDVYGYASGITVNSQSASVYLNSTGLLESARDNAVEVTANSAAATIINSGSIDGFYRGISVYSAGTLQVTSTGTITSNLEGLRIRNTGSVNLNISGMITSGSHGISIANTGNGPIDLTTGVISAGNTGIRVDANTASAIDIDANGIIEDGLTGIYVRQSGSGSVTIDTVNIAADDYGINVSTYSGSTAPVYVTTSGVIQTGGVGIRVYAYDSDITVNAEEIRTYGTGIFAQGDDISITSNDRISFRPLLATEDVYGIQASSLNGDVTINNASGIIAANSFVDAARSVGIDAYAFSGNIFITNTAGVANVNYDGIGIDARSIFGNVTVTATGNTRGSGVGINAVNSGGTGDVTVTHYGYVQGLTAISASIFATNSTNDIRVTSDGDVFSYAGGTGISVLQQGEGDIIIETRSEVEGGARGINAEMERNYGRFYISTYNVEGDAFGIYATSGSGSAQGNNYGLSITSSGHVEGGTNAVRAISHAAGDTYIGLTTVSSANTAIYARQEYTGGILALAFGNVDGNVRLTAISGDTEFRAYSDLNGSLYAVGGAANVSVAGAVTDTAASGAGGIIVRGRQSAYVSVAQGVSSNNGVGIQATVYYGDGLTIMTPGFVSSDGIAIEATLQASAYSGDLNIQAGNVSGEFRGIRAQILSTDNFDDLIVRAGTVTGEQTIGLELNHVGGGLIDVDVTEVNSDNLGVNALVQYADINMTIDRVDSGGSGINVGSYSGDVNVTITDNIWSSGGRGIFVRGGYGETVIDTGQFIVAGGEGINVTQSGNGTVDIAAGAILSNLGTAVNVDTRSNPVASGGFSLTTTGLMSGNMIFQFGDVISTDPARQAAIDLANAQGDAIIVLNGQVNSGRFGLRTTNPDGVVLEMEPGSSIDGDTAAIRLQGNGGDLIYNGGAILADVLTLNGDDTFVHQSGGTVQAGRRVDLGTDNDIFWMTADFTGLDGAIRGGLGTDTFRLGGTTGTWSGGSGFDSSQVRQFEIIEAVSGGDWTLSGTHFNYNEANFRSGSTTELAAGGRIFSDTVTLESGAFFDMDNGSSFNRTIFDLSGTLDIGGAGTTGASSVLGTVNMGASGVLNIDAVASGDNDLLRITGNFANQGTINLNSNGTLNLNQTYALETGQYVIINAVQALNGTFGTVNGLGSGGGLTQSLVYNTNNNTVRVLTQTSAMTPQDTGSKSSASAANYLLDQLGNTSEYAELGFNVGTIASVAEIGGFASGITPDVLDSAVMISDGAALRFGNALAGCDVNFSLNAAQSCASLPGSDGPAMFGEIRQTSANTGTEVGHNFNAQSFDINIGMRLTDSDDRTQFGLMSGYAKSGSVSDALAGESRDGLEAESFSFGGYARRDLGWWSLDGTAMVSTSEAKLVRNIQPGLGIAEQANAEFVSRQFNLQSTATLNGWGSTALPVKPLATVGNRTLQRDGFTESGAELLGLTVEGQTRNVSYAGLGAEFAPDFTDEQGNGFRGLLRVTGLAYAGDTESDFTARFTNAQGDSTFTYFGQNLDTSVLLEGGFQYIAGDGFAIGAEGFGEVNPETGDSSSVGATLQLIKRW